MATHSSILAEPGGRQSMGSQRVRHNWGTEHTWIVDLLCCVSFSRIAKWFSYIHLHESTLFKILFPCRLLQDTESSSLCYTAQFSSVTQSCPTLCNPMDCSMPGLPVHHQIPELAQTHVHRVDDAIQPSHPLSSLSPPALNLSRRQDLPQGVSPSHKVAKVLELLMNIQYWFPLGLTSLILLSKGFSRVFSNTTIQKHQFFLWLFMVQLSHPYMTTGKTIALATQTFVSK